MLNQFRYPVWQEPYLAAMIEMDSTKTKAKIAFAEDAIRVCMIDGEAEPAEREAIVDALNALKFIKR
jgi:tellurite resistance protein